MASAVPRSGTESSHLLFSPLVSSAVEQKVSRLRAKPRRYVRHERWIVITVKISRFSAQDFIPSCAYNCCVGAHVTKLAEADFPTRWGRFRIYGFEGCFEELPGRDGDSPRSDSVIYRKENAVALVMGDVQGDAPLVRIHSQCLTGDVFGSQRCDCRQQLELALRLISEAGRGVLIYEEQEGRGIGLMAKLQAYELQDKGLDTVEANEELGLKADYRLYTLPVEILKALGVKKLRLLSNNPAKVKAVEDGGIEVVERVSAEVDAYPTAEAYLRTKKEKLGHILS